MVVLRRAPRAGPLRCPAGTIDSGALQALLVDAIRLVLPRTHPLDTAVDEHVVLERPAQLAAHVAAPEAALGDLHVQRGGQRPVLVRGPVFLLDPEEQEARVLGAG